MYNHVRHQGLNITSQVSKLQSVDLTFSHGICIYIYNYIYIYIYIYIERERERERERDIYRMQEINIMFECSNEHTCEVMKCNNLETLLRKNRVLLTD